MQRKLTITIDEQVYTRLHEVVGRGRISRFIEELAYARTCPGVTWMLPIGRWLRMSSAKPMRWSGRKRPSETPTMRRGEV